MKIEAFRVEFVARRSCFLYFPQLWLSKLNQVDTNIAKICLKMSHGIDKCSYFSSNVQPYVSSNNEQCVGINATYAKLLGIKENEEVFISLHPYAAPVRKIEVNLISIADHEIMEMNMTEIQASLLDQVRMVCPGQPFLVWVSKNLNFSLLVGAVFPDLQIGILETFTDLVFTNPSTTSDTRSNTGNLSQTASSMENALNQESFHENNIHQQPNNTEPGSSMLNIWESFKNKLFPSHIHESNTYQQEEKFIPAIASYSSILNELEWTVAPVQHVFRVHPLELENMEPANAADLILKHPFNVFIHKSNLPSECSNIDSIYQVILCRISVLTAECLTEKNESAKSEILKQRLNVREGSSTAKDIKLPRAIFARVISIEDMHEQMSQEIRNSCKNFKVQTGYKHILMANSMRSALKIDIGCRIELAIEKYEKKEASTVEITPLDMPSKDIQTLFVAHVTSLVKSSSLLLNLNTAIQIPKPDKSTPVKVLIRVLPLEPEYVLFDSESVRETNFVIGNKKGTREENAKTAVAPAINNPKIISCATRSLVDEGVAAAEMDLNLQPSLHFYNKPFSPSNILIVGQAGSGKTMLAQHLCQELKASPNFVHCVEVQCTHLKGKMVETLQKKLDKWVGDCTYHQPSILFLDNVDALMGITPAEEEGSQQDIHSLRVCEMLTETIHAAQRSNYMLVIATAPALARLTASVSSPRGQHFFKVILQIPELSKDDRRDAIKELLTLKTEKLHKVDLELHASKTEGYVVQDIVDMVDKAIFEAWKRKVADGATEMKVEDGDITEAISNTVPLSLQGVTLFKDATHTWDDIGGLAEVKSTLIEVLQWPSQYMDLYASCPLRLQTGLLLYGAPGTGKTMLAAAVAHECGLNFISVKGPELLSKYIGASEEGVRNIFKKAQSARPCVLFFDEFDSLAPRRGHDSTGVTDRVVNQLLTQLDGVEKLVGVWVVAATSRPDLLDPALLRPGRLDKAVLCPMPGPADRRAILAALSRKMRLAGGVELTALADAADGFTGADLQAVLYAAQVAALEEARQSFESPPEDVGKEPSEVLIEVTQTHLLTALAETRPSLPSEERLRYQRIYDKFVGTRSGKRKEVEVLQQRTTLA